MVEVRFSLQGDPCITLPGSVHLATSLVTLTSKVKLAFKKSRNKMIRNCCNIFKVDGGIHTKNGGKTYASCALHMMQFSFHFWSGYHHQPKKYYNDSLSK